MYSELDPHKKGYLSDNDWELAFGRFNARNTRALKITELADALAACFSDARSAYEYFLEQSKSSGTVKPKGISWDEFCAGF